MHNKLLLVRRCHWRADKAMLSEQGKVEITRLTEVLRRNGVERDNALIFYGPDGASHETARILGEALKLCNPIEAHWLNEDYNIVAELIFGGIPLIATLEPPCTIVILVADQGVLKKIAHNYGPHIETGMVLEIDHRNGPPRLIH